MLSQHSIITILSLWNLAITSKKWCQSKIVFYFGWNSLKHKLTEHTVSEITCKNNIC